MILHAVWPLSQFIIPLKCRDLSNAATPKEAEERPHVVIDTPIVPRVEKRIYMQTGESD